MRINPKAPWFRSKPNGQCPICGLEALDPNVSLPPCNSCKEKLTKQHSISCTTCWFAAQQKDGEWHCERVDSFNTFSAEAPLINKYVDPPEHPFRPLWCPLIEEKEEERLADMKGAAVTRDDIEEAIEIIKNTPPPQPIPIYCPHCNGAGTIYVLAEPIKQICDMCDGRGTI